MFANRFRQLLFQASSRHKFRAPAQLAPHSLHYYSKPRFSSFQATRSFRFVARPTKPTSPFSINYPSRFQQARSRSTYRTFGAAVGTATLLRRWAARPTFYYEVGGIAVGVFGFYLYNQEEVAVTGRRRFNPIRQDWEEDLGKQQYREIMQQYRNRILPEHDPRAMQVRRVLERLIPSSGLADKAWEVHVIDSPDEANAFVLPGGKVFVFTGILPISKDDNGLAAVLGHEIAHNVAHHAAEGLTKSFVLLLGVWALEILGLAPREISQTFLSLAFERPGSRRQESEADHIGLLIMAEACYDPRSAVAMWKRMEAYEKAHGTVPQILSTHPSSHNRQIHLEQLMPQAMDKLEDAGCSRTTTMMDDFRQGGAMGSRWS